MTFLRTAFRFAVQQRIVGCWSSKAFCSDAGSSSVGEEVTKDFGNNYDENIKNIGNGNLELQSTIRQSVINTQKRQKLTKDISRGPGLKDFVTNSALQPVDCDSVPYVRNITIKGLNRKGKHICPVAWFDVINVWR